MQLKYLKSITQPTEGVNKVTAICWAPNGKKLAICTSDRVVVMFDEDGNRKDKFSTKPIDKVYTSTNYLSFIYFHATKYFFRDPKIMSLDKWHFLHSQINWLSPKLIIWSLFINLVSNGGKRKVFVINFNIQVL